MMLDKEYTDKLTSIVHTGNGTYARIINPHSFDDGGLEWQCRYGDANSVKYLTASIIGSYDLLLSDAISTTEAIKRLRILRESRKALKGQQHDK